MLNARNPRGGEGTGVFVFNAAVASGKCFHVLHALGFPRKENEEVRSHPVYAWKPRKASAFSAPMLKRMRLMEINRCCAPLPNCMHISPRTFELRRTAK